ncbi:MAG: Asp-tRNA(Asn)/Glu-tRNA(Gln) amidotransferase subunit GatA [Epsilonproteobacteria bacterium]|nr:Asp-tRNA(Asn)/Glu-tRNA(Gln) amidotransferase subunit GatA [Campylobacterota bacterium]
MISLKELLNKSKEEIKEIKDEILKKAKESDINAYIGFEDGGDGIPILIKDNIQVKNWSITCGSNILQGYIAPYNATAIENLKKNGFAPLGRANMDEFAMGSTTESSFYGPTKNPHAKDRVPGGSSGGSAAAVGANIAIAALGSDTGGSIRQPAAYCGVVGFKPTYGRVSRYGLGAYASSLDQIGPITRSVEDAAILYDAICGYDPKDSTSANIEYKPTFPNLDPNKKFKIALIENFVEEASEDIQKGIEDTIDALSKRGHEIIKVKMHNPKYYISTYYIVATAEAATNLARYDGIRYGNRAKDYKDLKELYFKTRSEGFGEEVKRRILLGNFVLSSGYYDAYYLKAQKVRHIIRDDFNKIFSEADIILMPVTPNVAPKIGELSDPLEMYKSDIFTVGINLVGLPAISIPVRKSSLNLPVGVQLVGKAFDEINLLSAALSLEEAISFKN